MAISTVDSLISISIKICSDFQRWIMWTQPISPLCIHFMHFMQRKHKYRAKGKACKHSTICISMQQISLQALFQMFVLSHAQEIHRNNWEGSEHLRHSWHTKTIWFAQRITFGDYCTCLLPKVKMLSLPSADGIMPFWCMSVFSLQRQQKQRLPEMLPRVQNSLCMRPI